jgi:hypothetical protein
VPLADSAAVPAAEEEGVDVVAEEAAAAGGWGRRSVLQRAAEEEEQAFGELQATAQVGSRAVAQARTGKRQRERETPCALGLEK